MGRVQTLYPLVVYHVLTSPQNEWFFDKADLDQATSMPAGGQVAKTSWALCEKAPLEAHPGLARQGELDTRGLS